MATFGKFETSVEPSDLGKNFVVDTLVAFLVDGQAQTGKITKQLQNSAVVEVDSTTENKPLMRKSNGVIIVNYKHLRKI